MREGEGRAGSPCSPSGEVGRERTEKKKETEGVLAALPLGSWRGQGGVRGTETRCRSTGRELRWPWGTAVRQEAGTRGGRGASSRCPPPPANQSGWVSLLTPGCLAERWSGKKGDPAALGGKKSKKKSSRVKASGGGSKQRKELGGLEEDPSPEEDEGIQKASPLTHSPPDEL